MRWIPVVVIAAAAACGFPSPVADEPPAAAEVRFVSVTASEAMLRPGLYGIEVAAVLRNELDVEITGIRASLAFHEGITNRAGDFRWRDADARDGVKEPQPASIPPGGEATFRFRVDALAYAAGTGPVTLDGTATFQLDGGERSATLLDPPARLPFAAMPPPIRVNTTADEDDGDAEISLREAVKLANMDPGFDRIVFDPGTFPPGGSAVTVLDPALGEIPAVAGDLVIDGSTAGFALAAGPSWEAPGRWYGLRLASGTLVVHGIGFQDMGHGYPAEILTTNCGAGPNEGGAIRADGGTLILDGNQLSDAGVTERNCFAASVRLEGGAGHRILNNIWTEQSMDSLFIRAATREVSGNAMTAGSVLDKADDCIVINSLGDADLWIVGNLCVDQEYSAILATGTDAGKLYVVHNTFARNRSGSGVRRGGSRYIELHNNAYHANQPAAISADGSGVNLDISHEAESGNGMFCGGGCTSADIEASSIWSGELGFANPPGITRVDFTPIAGSRLVDSGIDLIDRNGSAPGRYNGVAPERGAVELP